MPVQSIPLCKCLSTGLTFVRPLPRVDPSVTHQSSFLRKGLLTNLAPVWLFARVNPLVRPQVGLLCECLVAEAADEGLLTSVRPLVSGNVHGVGAGVRAEAALVLVPPLVAPSCIRLILSRRVVALAVAGFYLGPVWHYLFYGARSEDRTGIGVEPPAVLHLRLLPVRLGVLEREDALPVH